MLVTDLKLWVGYYPNDHMGKPRLLDIIEFCVFKTLSDLRDKQFKRFKFANSTLM